MTDDILLTLFPYACILLGGLGIWGHLRLARVARRAPDWPTTTGRILSSELVTETDRSDGITADSPHGVGRSGSRTTRYRPSVLYEYRVHTRTFTGHRIGLSSESPRDPEAARAIVRRFDPGAQVTVHYDPDAPGVAVLDPTYNPAGNGPLLFISLAFFALGSVWAVVALV